MDEATRAWIYRILVALGAVALVYGVASDEVDVWLAVAAAVLTGGNGLAAKNTSTK